MLRVLFALIGEVVGNLFAGIDAVNYIFWTSPDLVVNSTYILTNYTNSEQVEPPKETNSDQIGSPCRHSQAGNKFMVKSITCQC